MDHSDQERSAAVRGAGDMPRNDSPAPDPMTYATPRWVKVFGTIVTIVVLLFVFLRFTVFREH